MFISRPALPPNSPIYEHHQALWGYFPDLNQAGTPRPFLFRHLNGGEGDRVLMLSRVPPRCDAEHVGSGIKNGHSYPFDAVVAPRSNGHSETRSSGQKVKIYREPDEVRAWLDRRLDGAAKAHFVRVEEAERLHFHKCDGRLVLSDRVRLRGMIEVTDRAAFLEILAKGIGSGKCWGNGMIVIPEVMGA